MTETEIWTITAIAVVIAALIGFAIGRKQQPGSNDKLKTLSEEYELRLAEKQAEIDDYRDRVHSHYEKTAGLFVSMAGSYKELFDHLSEGYEQIGDNATQKILPERAGALLDGPEANEADDDAPFGAIADNEAPDYQHMNSTASKKDY